MANLKLGRKAVKTDSRTLKLAKYTLALPAAPATCDWTKGITAWGAMLNDQLGDCLIGDTLTVAPRMLKAYRSLYDGPVVNIKTCAGKNLTSTRNHMVLTSRGLSKGL